MGNAKRREDQPSAAPDTLDASRKKTLIPNCSTLLCTYVLAPDVN